MEINWIAVGWIIDMILNGFVWLIIAVLGLSLIDITDKWIRKTLKFCLLYTSPSPRDISGSRMPSSA